MSHAARAKPAASCPFCLSWGVFGRADSCCRACYDFGRTYPGGQCAGCRRIIAVKNGYCRLCWLQAGITAAGRARITAADLTPGTRCQQLSFAGMSQRIGHVDPPRDPPAPPAAPPAACTGTQLELCGPGESRHFDKRHWVASSITNPALAQTRHIARDLAETRGWNARIVAETRRALAVILAGHAPGDVITWSALAPALRTRDLSISRAAEILSLAGLLHDDRIPSFTALMQARLAQLPPLIAADVGHWLRARTDGGPRSRPRHTDTVRKNFNRVRPLLLEWAGHHSHLREITTSDIIAATTALQPNVRRQTLTALRSLFGHCKRTGTIFADPTRGIPAAQRPLTLLQPLQSGEIDQAAAAAVTPAARLALALAAVHAARPGAIRQLRLDDIDLGNRRLVINGRARPLDDLTRHLLLAWLEHRRRRWPGTANPHLILNQQTAMSTRPVSENWITGTFRGLTATLERLRADRQLEEALTHGPDPLHLAAVFGLDDTTAIRYATIARQLLETPPNSTTPASSREHRDRNRR